MYMDDMNEYTMCQLVALPMVMMGNDGGYHSTYARF